MEKLFQAYRAAGFDTALIYHMGGIAVLGMGRDGNQVCVRFDSHDDVTTASVKSALAMMAEEIVRMENPLPWRIRCLGENSVASHSLLEPVQHHKYRTPEGDEFAPIDLFGKTQ